MSRFYKPITRVVKSTQKLEILAAETLDFTFVAPVQYGVETGWNLVKKLGRLSKKVAVGANEVVADRVVIPVKDRVARIMADRESRKQRESLRRVALENEILAGLTLAFEDSQQRLEDMSLELSRYAQERAREMVKKIEVK